jgi:hypothetical protein
VFDEERLPIICLPFLCTRSSCQLVKDHPVCGSLAEHDMAEPPALRFPQLTRLQLWCCAFDMRAIGVMVSGLQRLEVLQVLHQPAPTIELRDAGALLQLPRLREVDLTGSDLWVHDVHTMSKPPGYLPEHVAEQLLTLRTAGPHIDWVLRGNMVTRP